MLQQNQLACVECENVAHKKLLQTTLRIYVFVHSKNAACQLHTNIFQNGQKSKLSTIICIIKAFEIHCAYAYIDQYIYVCIYI